MNRDAYEGSADLAASGALPNWSTPRDEVFVLAKDPARLRNHSHLRHVASRNDETRDLKAEDSTWPCIDSPRSTEGAESKWRSRWATSPPPLFAPNLTEQGAGDHDAPQATHPKGARRPATTKRQSTRRFQVLNFTATRHFRRGLHCSTLCRLIWLLIWSFVDAKTGVAVISYQALASKAGLKTRQTQKIVRELLDCGYLELTKQGGPKMWAVNHYRVHSAPASGLTN